MFQSLTRRQMAVMAAALLALCALLLLPFILRTPEEHRPASVSAGTPGVRVPIIMYHSLLRDETYAGTYVVSPDTLESDMRYLRDQGYTAVLISELIAYVNGEGELPEKPIVLTFDDGYLNNLVYLPPLLEKYDMRAVISVVGEYTETFSNQADHSPSYAHLTWDDIAVLNKSSRIEFANHSYSMHSQSERIGAAIMANESWSAYQSALSEDALKMQIALREHSGVDCLIFTYPYGQVTEGADDILRELGIAATLSCLERVNIIRQSEPECLFWLGRFNRPSGITSEAFFSEILNK